MSHEKYSHERVIALGDSVTFGVGDIGKNFVGPGWGARVAHELNAKRFLNLSNLGARVRHLSEEQLPAALAFRPTIAIISIGGNDLLRSTFDPVEMECHLERVVIALRRIQCEVVLLQIPDPRKTAPGPRMLREALGARRRELAGLILRVAVNTRASVVQVSDSEAMARREIWHIDRMHPSALGHQLLSDLTLRALNKDRLLVSLSVNQVVTQKESMKWFASAATMWFIKRSVDLIPTLIWLGIKYRISKLVFRKKRVKITTLESQELFAAPSYQRDEIRAA